MTIMIHHALIESKNNFKKTIKLERKIVNNKFIVFLCLYVY